MPPAPHPSLAGGIRASIVQGDAFDLIKEVRDHSVDLLLTSPPYWGLRSYGQDHTDAVAARWEATGCTPDRVPPYEWYRGEGGVLGLEPYPHWYVTHLVEFFTRAKRVLKPTASVWVNLGDTYFARWSSIRDNGRQGFNGGRHRRRTPSGGYLHDKQMLLVPARFAIAMQDAGWILRNDLIWSKPTVIPRPESDRLRLSHEHWFHFVARTPGARPTYFYDVGGCEEGMLDVVSCPPSAGNNGHSATFPVELIRPRILSSSPKNGLLLDPFCGTGRAVTEALRVGRRALGFELAAPHARTGKAELVKLLPPKSSSSRRKVVPQ